MAQSLKIDNFAVTNIIDRNILAADAPASSVDIALANTYSYGNGQYLMVGALGMETAELSTITSIAGAIGLVIAPLKLNHYQTEPVTILFGNQINIYRAPDVDGEQPADPTFALLATVNIDYTNQTSGYTDAAGGVNYWYKYTYLNQTTNAETSIADSAAVRGGGYGNYATLDQIREEAGLSNNSNILDSEIARKRKRAQNIIDGYLYEVYTTPFAVPVPPIINTCCILLAAGWMLLEQYGTSATGMSKDGQAKINQVMAPAGAKNGELGILDLIKMREITVIDAAGVSLLESDLTSSSPDNSTDPTTTTVDPVTVGNDRYFSMGDRY